MRLLLILLLFLAAPALAMDRGAARKAQIAELLAALKDAGTETEAVVLEAHLRELWLRAGTPAVTLLISRGLHDLKAGANGEAEQDFAAAIALDPTLAAAYDQRAVARFQAGNVDGAVRDLHAALQREPRDFLAWRRLAEIAEARGDWAQAFAAWQKLMALDPKTPGGEQKLKALRRHALGENA
jgi:tetratricopeptide (TPR) repeat protein